jgi:hypothetical protein
MPAWAATLVVGAITLAGNFLVTAFYYGRLTERVSTLQKQFENHVESHESTERDQWSDIAALRESVAKVKGKLGINGA